MKTATKRIATLSMAILLVFCGSMLGGYSAAASEPLGSSIFANTAVPLGYSTCSTQVELDDILTTHLGGTVYLTDNIVVTGSFPANHAEHTTELVFEMGDFGITLSENTELTVKRPLVFRGSGREVPLFTTEANAGIFNYDFKGSFPIELIATGDNATAIEVNGVYFQNAPRYSLAYASDFLFTITTTGKNATAVYANRRIYLEYLKINAIGENNTAVQAWHDIDVFLCDISATDTSLISDSGQIYIDTSVVSSIPEDAIVLERETFLYIDYRLNDYGLFSTLGDELEFPEYDIMYVQFTPEYPEKTRKTGVDIIWDSSGVDVNQVGIYSVLATPKISSNLLKPLRVDINIIEENAPIIKYVLPFTYDSSDALKAQIVTAAEIPIDENTKIWISDNNGETWEDYTGESTVNSGEDIRVTALQENQKYLIRVEWMQENELVVTNEISYTHALLIPKSLSGDRDGGDRDIGEENVRPPVATKPPVTPTNPVEPEKPTNPPTNPPVEPEKPTNPPVIPPTTGEPEKPTPVNPTNPLEPEKPTLPPVAPPITPETTAPTNPAKPPQGSGSSSAGRVDTGRIIAASESSEAPQSEAPQNSVPIAEDSVSEGITDVIDDENAATRTNALGNQIEANPATPNEVLREEMPRPTTAHEEQTERNERKTDLTAEIDATEKATSAVFVVVPLLVVGLGTAWVVLKIKTKK